MIKMISAFRRKPGMTVEAFQDYWRDVHADIVCQMPGIRRYVQSHTLLSGYRTKSPAYDGVAELWFDNSDALRALAGTEVLDNTRRDHHEFMDMSSYVEFMTEDVVIKDGDIPESGVKNIEFVRKKDSMSPEDFHQYWITTHGPLGSSIPSHMYGCTTLSLPSSMQTGSYVRPRSAISWEGLFYYSYFMVWVVLC